LGALGPYPERPRYVPLAYNPNKVVGYVYVVDGEVREFR
jgi:hypothetical protein